MKIPDLTEFVWSHTATQRLDQNAWSGSKVDMLIIEEQTRTKRREIVSSTSYPNASRLNLPGVNAYRYTDTTHQTVFLINEDHTLVVDVVFSNEAAQQLKRAA